jgi:hypothetical protein
METKIERSITYTYGPDGIAHFTGKFSGEYTWEQLEGFIREERWGSPYTVTERKERTVTYSDWVDVAEASDEQA